VEIEVDDIDTHIAGTCDAEIVTVPGTDVVRDESIRPDSGYPLCAPLKSEGGNSHV